MIVFLVKLSIFLSYIDGFVILPFLRKVQYGQYNNEFSLRTQWQQGKHSQRREVVVVAAANDEIVFEDGEVGSGPNWIERSFPVDVGKSSSAKSLKSIEDYNIGISGVAFSTGPLSKRMLDAIMSKTSMDVTDDAIRRALTVYAMDFSAKEAVRAALKQNGLEMALQEEEEDAGMWGDVDSIRLLDPATNEPTGQLYESVEEAIDDWIPGQGFDFVARQVPAKMMELSLSDLLQALDPDGTLRQQAKSANMTLIDEQNETDSDDVIRSLKDLAEDCFNRTQNAPREVSSEEEAFSGLDSRGYRIMNCSDLLRDNVEHTTLMHLMDALVSHGALVVDMADGGANYSAAKAIASMWRTTEDFFRVVNSNDHDHDNIVKQLPGMTTVAETGSLHAKVGYVDYDNSAMQFLETRLDRYKGTILPREAENILGLDGVSALKKAFDSIALCGKNIVKIAVAASTIEAGAFHKDNDDDDDDDETTKAFESADLLATELVDDGHPLVSTVDMDYPESSINMSPHRLCRYTNNNNDKVHKEVFGAHTDASFLTAVPVAAVTGLEVYDESEERWYRPELAARKHWQKQQEVHGEHSSNEVFIDDDNDEEQFVLPWYARYVVFMAGELLQLTTRNEVPATVHRVVASFNATSRLSAPVLLRCRPNMKMNVERYLGRTCNHPLLEECDGMRMEHIHSVMQPKPQ